MYSYENFKAWVAENNELTENLQTWLFYRYAIANGLTGDVDVSVDSADIVVYFALFYISSTKGNEYAFMIEKGILPDMLETEASVVEKALHSLENHGLISLIEEGDLYKITIQPITATPHHHHHHHRHHDE